MSRDRFKSAANRVATVLNLLLIGSRLCCTTGTWPRTGARVGSCGGGCAAACDRYLLRLIICGRPVLSAARLNVETAQFESQRHDIYLYVFAGAGIRALQQLLLLPVRRLHSRYLGHVLAAGAAGGEAAKTKTDALFCRWPSFMNKKRHHFCQDRLGTDVAKAETRGMRFTFCVSPACFSLKRWSNHRRVPTRTTQKKSCERHYIYIYITSIIRIICIIILH
jgi:hypothetical protein|eukprot:COSAG06_NODE_4059_length_4615_cov_166.531665_3_plen_222_part_00